MHVQILYLACTFISTCLALSLPPLQTLQSPSLHNSLLLIPPTTNTTSPSPLRAKSWPTPPFRVHVIDDIYLTITSYTAPVDYGLKGYVLMNITAIETQIESEHQPVALIDNQRTFRSGLVSAKFPKTPGTARLTNELAMHVLGAAWQLQYIYGPRGFSYAVVEHEDRPWSYFSLKIEGRGLDALAR